LLTTFAVDGSDTRSGADMLGASLTELLPGSPGGPLHMHYGVEEMFFVLGGTPTVRTPDAEDELSPGDVVYFPEGLTDSTRSRTRRTSRHGCSASPRNAFLTLSPIPSGALRGWRRVTPNARWTIPGDKGIIARFELPPDQA
jgi:Cupin domain